MNLISCLNIHAVIYTSHQSTHALTYVHTYARTHTHFQHVKPDIVKLLVIENLMLQPCSDVYILPLSFVDYRVERRKQGRTEVVPMPSDQYTLELTNTTVGRLDRRRSRVTGLVIGDTELVLQDKSMPLLIVLFKFSYMRSARYHY